MKYYKAISDEYSNSLAHYGVLGMKWGVRRYQDYGHGGYNPKHEGSYKGRSENYGELTRSRTNMSPKLLKQSATRNAKQIASTLAKTEKQMNCVACTFSLDFRLRGYKDALPQSTKYILENKLDTWESIKKTYKQDPNRKTMRHQASLDDPKSLKKLFFGYRRPYVGLSKMEKQAVKDMIACGNGARGQFLTSFVQIDPFTGKELRVISGHSRMWQVEGKKLYIYDAQTGKRESVDIVLNTLKTNGTIYVQTCLDDWIRTDNIEPDEKMIKKYLQNV